jgi:hypothetical protein
MTSLLYNPMLLMMLASVFMMVVLPKMLPEDVRREVEQTQAQMGSNPLEMLKKMASGEGFGDEANEDAVEDRPSPQRAATVPRRSKR